MSELLNFILDHEDAFKSKARLASLYSDFARLKNTNPDGYWANVRAWSSAFTHANQAGVGTACGSNRLAIQAGSQLERELHSKNLGGPVALGAVVDEAVKAGDLIPLQDFLESTASIYRKPGWIPQFHVPTAWQVAQWGLRQVGFGGGSKLVEGEYVVKANVEAASRETLRRLSEHVNTSNPTSQIYSLETFTHAFSKLLGPKHVLSPSETHILLTHLSRDLRACSVSWPSSKSDLTTIKFGMPGSTSAPPAITNQDTTIAQLSALQLSLTNQITSANNRLNELESQIRTSVATSSKNPAGKERTLDLLRNRKALTTTLIRRQTSLHQIESVLQSIDDAASQVDMVRAMRDSTAVLRDLNAQVGGVEGVEKVMDALRDEMLDVEEVGKVFAEDVGNVDEGEVEDELEDLLREEKARVGGVTGASDADKGNQRPLPQEVDRPVANLAETMPKVPETMPRVPESITKVPEAIPRTPETGIGPIERRRIRNEQAEMDKRLSRMSLEEEPTGNSASNQAMIEEGQA